MIFVDTSAWYAVFKPKDPKSIHAKKWFDENSDQLVTSDFVVDELLTLLRSRNENERALEAGEILFGCDIARLEYLTVDDIAAAWNIFRAYDDKGWSFTDCTSFALIHRMGISKAFAFDEHFDQYGKLIIFPQAFT